MIETERNFQNNPTGKPYCCHDGCNKDATWELFYGPGHEDMTHACDEHVIYLIPDDSEQFNAHKLVAEGKVINVFD